MIKRVDFLTLFASEGHQNEVNNTVFKLKSTKHLLEKNFKLLADGRKNKND